MPTDTERQRENNLLRRQLGECAADANRPEASMAAIGKVARGFLSEVKDSE